MHIQSGGKDEDFLQQEAFKNMMNLEANKEIAEEAKMQRLIKRKKDNPTANAKNFD